MGAWTLREQPEVVSPPSLLLWSDWTLRASLLCPNQQPLCMRPSICCNLRTRCESSTNMLNESYSASLDGDQYTSAVDLLIDLAPSFAALVCAHQLQPAG